MKTKVKKGLWILTGGLGVSIIATPLLVSCSQAGSENVNNPQTGETIPNMSSMKLDLTVANTNVTAGDNVTLTLNTNYKGNQPLSYQWFCKKEHESKFKEMVAYKSADGLSYEFPNIDITYNKAQFYVEATNQAHLSKKSNTITLTVAQTNPVSSLSLKASQNVYRPGDTLIVYSNIATHQFAINDPNEIQYSWTIRQPNQEWVPIKNIANGVLKLDNVTLAYNDCEIQATAHYQDFSFPSNIYKISVSQHAQPNPDALPNISDSSNDKESVDAAIKGYSQSQVANDSITSFGVFNRVELSQSPRPAKPGLYDSQMYHDYHDTYGFVYPAQNFNYKWAGPNKNNPNKADKESWGIFHNKNNPSDTINATALLMNEQVPTADRVNATNPVRYNNPYWIKTQIKNGTLKRHRASEGFYLNNMDNIPVTKMHYEVSTAITGHEAIGLYAPAGEVVTFTFDQDTWDLMKSRNWSDLNITINQNFWDNYGPSDSGRISNRYPYVRSAFRLTLDDANRQIKVGSPFGGSLGLRIGSTLNKTGSFPLDSSPQNLKFTVDGAIKCMFYQDGFTTEKDWAQQIIDVQNQKLAPVLQGITPYNTLTIPFTDYNTVGHRSVKSLKYPRDNFKKWDDFLYLSNLYAGRDRSLHRLDMEFCDDIWGGAAAWGGGMTFYCPTNWGVGTMFCDAPINVFNSANAWGVFHEINHNFQQNSAFFRRNTHPETNQVSGFDLSVISDAGRFRSELNWCGEQNKANNNLGWSRLNNPFTVMKYTSGVGQVDDEYLIYAILLFTLGSKQYVDYLRDDVINHPSSAGSWTGFDEIKRLSETFKLNFWPTFYQYGNDHWCDTWPTSSNPPNDKQKQVIADLESKYPAVDFVGNQYASGIYMYDKDTRTYNYTHDVVNPYEIPAGKPYNFDFEHFIVSTNPNFNWNNLMFETTSKLGGSLALDSNNPKRVIYTPPANNITGVDEFDVAIIPGTWDGKSSNYVPTIKWKVKVRQVVNEAIIETFTPFGPSNSPRKLNEWFNTLKTSDQVKYRLPLISFKTNMFLDQNQYEGVRIKFKFIAPKTGHYVFKNTWDDAVRMYVNGENIPINNQDRDNAKNFAKTYEKDLNVNDELDFEFLVINYGGGGGFNMTATVDGQGLDFYNNIVSPDFHQVVSGASPRQVINDPSYQYKPRLIDREIFNKDFSSNVNFSSYETPILDTNSYTLSSSNNETNGLVNKLNNYNDFIETWHSLDAPAGKGVKFKYKIQFKKPTKVSTLYFGNVTEKHTEYRAQTVKVDGFATAANTNPVHLYDGAYPNRNGSISTINLNQTMLVDHLEIDLSTKTNGLLLKWMRIGEYPNRPYGSSIAMNNPHVGIQGKWAFRYNDELNSSAINNMYAVSTSANDFIEVSFKNLEGFALVGQSNNLPTEFEVYVNGQKLDTKTVSSNNTLYNQNLYSHLFDSPQDVTIKVKHNDKNPLFFNYIMTFGKNVIVD